MNNSCCLGAGGCNAFTRIKNLGSLTIDFFLLKHPAFNFGSSIGAEKQVQLSQFHVKSNKDQQ